MAKDDENGKRHASTNDILHQAWRDSIAQRIRSLEEDFDRIKEQLEALRESVSNLFEP